MILWRKAYAVFNLQEMMATTPLQDQVSKLDSRNHMTIFHPQTGHWALNTSKETEPC